MWQLAGNWELREEWNSATTGLSYSYAWHVSQCLRIHPKETTREAERIFWEDVHPSFIYNSSPKLEAAQIQRQSCTSLGYKSQSQNTTQESSEKIIQTL